MSDQRTVTFYVIAYDISSDKRRAKVHKILSGFGQWTQFSLFECFLTEKQYLRLRQRLSDHLKPGEDSVRFYALCASCRQRSGTLEGNLPDEPELFVV